MRKTIIVALTIIMLSIGSLAFAISDTATHDVTMQVNEIALIDLNNTTAITLTTNAPTNGGEDVVGEVNSTSKLLQYTSLVASGVKRNISVQWGGTDAAPAGTSLKLEATTVGAGHGTAAPQVTISSTAQSLITAIGSCATGTGASGSALTYTFSIDDIPSLVVGDNKTVTLTFTLTDAS